MGDLERRTQASLVTPNHSDCSGFGKSGNAGRERAVYKEVMATVAHRRRKRQESKKAEQLENQRWAAESDQKFVQQWYATQERNRKAWASLVASWDAAAQAKKQQLEEEKVMSINSERTHNYKVIEGKDNRRTRKPVSGRYGK